MMKETGKFGELTKNVLQVYQAYIRTMVQFRLLELIFFLIWPLYLARTEQVKQPDQMKINTHKSTHENS